MQGYVGPSWWFIFRHDHYKLKGQPRPQPALVDAVYCRGPQTAAMHALSRNPVKPHQSFSVQPAEPHQFGEALRIHATRNFQVAELRMACELATPLQQAREEGSAGE